jgi:YVTN family beta-propeller protein
MATREPWGRSPPRGLVWAPFALGVLTLALTAPGVIAAAPGASVMTVPPSSAGGGADPSPLLPTVIASVPVGTDPSGAAVDLANGWVYVANEGSDNVSVLNDTSVVASVPLSGLVGGPDYVTYDPLNGLVYVVDQSNFEVGGGAVSVLNGTTVVATLPVGQLPNFAVLDPANGYLYVTDSGGDAVSVINAAGNATIANVTVGAGPTSAAYDPSSGYVYVANSGSANVSLLFGAHVAGSRPAGTDPSSAAYDPLNELVYVVNGGSDNATLYYDTSIAGNVTVGTDPTFDAYDPSVGGVEVANTQSNNVTDLNGTVAVVSLAVASGPVWVGPGAPTTFTFVAGENANAVSVLEGTAFRENVSVGLVPTFGVADPSNQLEYILNSGSANVSVLALAYPVTFDESGLAPGTSWSVTLAGASAASTTSTIEFGEPAGTYAYSVGVPSGYTLVSETPGSPLLVKNASVTVEVAFAAVSSATYPLTFVETGLGCAPSPPSYGVAEDGFEGGGHGSSCCPGTEKGPRVATLGGEEENRCCTTGGGGGWSGTSEGVGAWSKCCLAGGGGPGDGTYGGWEGGTGCNSRDGGGGEGGTYGGGGGSTSCSSGDGWTLDGLYGGSDGGSRCCPSGGGGGPDPLFGGKDGRGGCCEPSSPTNLTWSVTVAGVTKSTNGTTITFEEPNGSWGYAIGAPAGYAVTSSVPASPVTIMGAGVTVNVTFAPTTAPVVLSITFFEDGLPWGTVWCVNLSGAECSSDHRVVFANLSPGSYNFTVAPVGGYTAQPSSGTVVLVDRSVFVFVRFSAPSHGCGGW